MPGFLSDYQSQNHGVKTQADARRRRREEEKLQALVAVSPAAVA